MFGLVVDALAIIGAASLARRAFRLRRLFRR
ncbi:hypothetical protein FHR71_005456 [Methylobacterium sp. RAS18]|nr:hypothetical protein [Methylobacterium sp. RAS18]